MAEFYDLGGIQATALVMTIVETMAKMAGQHLIHVYELDRQGVTNLLNPEIEITKVNPRTKDTKAVTSVGIETKGQQVEFIGVQGLANLAIHDGPVIELCLTLDLSDPDFQTKFETVVARRMMGCRLNPIAAQLRRKLVATRETA